VVMICNGTGIAPFLGMINENRSKTAIDLYCGFRTNASFALYEGFLKQQLVNKKLNAYKVCLSREAQKEYVSHRILKDKEYVWNILRAGGVIMICGSLTMQNDV